MTDAPDSDDDQLTFSYTTELGTFEIVPEETGFGTYQLSILSGNNERSILGSFRSIQEAISAVMTQQTSHREWDQMGSKAVPTRIHDIMCWQIEKKSGT